MNSVLIYVIFPGEGSCAENLGQFKKRFHESPPTQLFWVVVLVAFFYFIYLLILFFKLAQTEVR